MHLGSWASLRDAGPRSTDPADQGWHDGGAPPFRVRFRQYRVPRCSRSHSMTPDGQRNIVGYGKQAPHPRWPRGARIAINFVLNIEEGSEYSIGDGDGCSKATVTEFDASYVPRGDRAFAAESMFEYGSRVGVWRVLRLFEQYGLPLTLNACALAVERHAELAATIREKNYDICCHGWRWIDHFLLSEETERQHIAKAIESLE